MKALVAACIVIVVDVACYRSKVLAVVWGELALREFVCSDEFLSFIAECVAWRFRVGKIVERVAVSAVLPHQEEFVVHHFTRESLWCIHVVATANHNVVKVEIV